MVEKVSFLSQIFEVEIFMNLHVMRSPESENHIFSVSSVCSVSVISITQKIPFGRLEGKGRFLALISKSKDLIL